MLRPSGTAMPITRCTTGQQKQAAGSHTPTQPAISPGGQQRNQCPAPGLGIKACINKACMFITYDVGSKAGGHTPGHPGTTCGQWCRSQQSRGWQQRCPAPGLLLGAMPALQPGCQSSSWGSASCTRSPAGSESPARSTAWALHVCPCRTCTHQP